MRLRCEPQGLQRVRATPTQTGLDRRARLKNLRDAFAVTLDVDGAHVALVDDVITTGATTAACAEVLLASGAATVDVWAVARVLRTAPLDTGNYPAG
jgi:predicted amidophosphoribosyltransferase